MSQLLWLLCVPSAGGLSAGGLVLQSLSWEVTWGLRVRGAQETGWAQPRRAAEGLPGEQVCTPAAGHRSPWQLSMGVREIIRGPPAAPPTPALRFPAVTLWARGGRFDAHGTQSLPTAADG